MAILRQLFKASIVRTPELGRPCGTRIISPTFFQRLRAGLSRFAAPRLDCRAFRPTESPETIWTLAARRHVREELKVSGRKLKGSRCAEFGYARAGVSALHGLLLEEILECRSGIHGAG
jgi:hypothetical protein